MFRGGHHAAGRRRRLEDRAAHTGHRALPDDQLVDPVPMRERYEGIPEESSGEDVDQRRTGAPGDVESRHRIPMSAGVVATALGPAHQWEDLQATVPSQGPLLAGGEIDVRVRPLLGPVVLGPVESGGAQPVPQGQFVAVADAHAALFGAVDEEQQAAERPEGLPAEVGGVLLLDEQHPLATFHQFTGGDQTGQAGSRRQ